MSAEWLVETGIGETRALLIEDGRVAEAALEREREGARAGDLWRARLTRFLGGGRALVSLGREEALLEPAPPGVTEGGMVSVEVTREAIPEPGRVRLAKVAATERALPPEGEGLVAPGPSLLERLHGSGLPVRTVAHGQTLDAAGWWEVMEQAATGRVAFAGGLLTISLTPAMTVIDVDGDLPPAELARAAARNAARAIRRLGITGSIGIDFPTLSGRAERQAVGSLVDQHLPPPFERTAMNGFGFLQIVRRRERPSLLELVQGKPVETAALGLLRLAERASGVGPRTLSAAPEVVDWLEARPALLEQLERATGAPVRLQPVPGRPISAIDVHVAPLPG